MEANVTMSPNDELIRMKSDQFMEDKCKLDFEQKLNQKLSHVQENYTPTNQVSNSLPTSIELVQLVQSKPFELIQYKIIYIFLEPSIVYAQHKSLKQVTFFLSKHAQLPKFGPKQ